MASRLSLLALAAQLLLANCYELAEVQFGVAKSFGVEYRRLIEPMPHYVAEESTSASSQVSIPISDVAKIDVECHL